MVPLNISFKSELKPIFCGASFKKRHFQQRGGRDDLRSSSGGQRGQCDENVAGVGFCPVCGNGPLELNLRTVLAEHE